LGPKFLFCLGPLMVLRRLWCMSLVKSLNDNRFKNDFELSCFRSMLPPFLNLVTPNSVTFKLLIIFLLTRARTRAAVIAVWPKFKQPSLILLSCSSLRCQYEETENEENRHLLVQLVLDMFLSYRKSELNYKYNFNLIWLIWRQTHSQ
jgi:hypothetical protein